MSRPFLLIVDGEPLRTQGLVSALEGDGWMVRWAHSSESPTSLGLDPAPDLLVLGPSAPGGTGYATALALRKRKPRLPVLLLSPGGVPTPGRQEPPLEVQAFLDPALPDGYLVAALHKYQPESRKLTTDELFGDLLRELERPAPPAAPSAPFPVPAAPPRARVPRPAAGTFGSGLEDAQTLPSAPKPSNPRPPASSGVPARAAGSRAALDPGDGGPLGPSDFTLSGLPDLGSPIPWPASQASPSPEGAQAPRTQLDPPGASAIEEYGNYFLLEKIAVGGMAELFKAQQRGVQGFQKIVAIKRILPHLSDSEDFVTMFIDEAKLAAQLTHPNIVQIFDLGKAGTSYYIAMEYVNGRDLRTLLRKAREYRTSFPEQVAAYVAMKVAAALDYAHRKRGFDDRELKLVHRDISPQNVILSIEGAVKLVDFGIAKAASKASHTVSGALKGKLLYMSPEQASGQSLDNRSDLYSLGLVLFELLTGERCFQADSELGVLEKVRMGRVSDLAALNPKVSREMAAIVSRALKKNVDHRYPSARVMERDLHAYLQRQGTPITEHDVAEYMHMLLMGSREELDALVSTRFPQPVSLVSGAHRGIAESTGPGSGSYPTLPVAAAPEERPPASPSGDRIGSTRPRWLLPVILVLAVILIIILAVVGRT